MDAPRGIPTGPSAFRLVIALLVFITVAGVLTACDPGQGGSQQDLAKQMGKLVGEVMRNSDVPMEEIKKLHQLEYQLITLPLESSAEAIEGALDEMGKNRWDCFHVEKHTRVAAGKTRQTVLTFFCKRPVETPLRYVPRTLIGR